MKIALIYRLDYDEFDAGSEGSELLGWVNPDWAPKIVSNLEKVNPPRLENRAAFMQHQDPEGKCYQGYPRFYSKILERLGDSGHHE